MMPASTAVSSLRRSKSSSKLPRGYSGFHGPLGSIAFGSECLMKCVFDPAQNAHAPHRYLRFGNIMDFPESPERVERLMDGAMRAGLDHVRPRAFDRTRIETVHTSRYVDFLENGHAQW